MLTARKFFMVNSFDRGFINPQISIKYIVMDQYKKSIGFFILMRSFAGIRFKQPIKIGGIVFVTN